MVKTVIETEMDAAREHDIAIRQTKEAVISRSD